MFKLDDYQSLVEPDFHDGLLRGIFIDNDYTLTVTCSNSDRVKDYRICLPKVKYLLADNFRQGNIVFNIYLFEGKQCPLDLLRKVSDLGETRFDDTFNNLVTQIYEEKWVLIHLSPSYGCELFALSTCSSESVSIAPVGI
jgi:hypothetical protein